MSPAGFARGRSHETGHVSLVGSIAIGALEWARRASASCRPLAQLSLAGATSRFRLMAPARWEVLHMALGAQLLERFAYGGCYETGKCRLGMP